MLPLLIQLLIDPILLLAYNQNSGIAIIQLMNNWLIYSVTLQTYLLLIKLPVPILIQGELKPTFLTLPVALSLTSSIIFYFNVIFTSTQIPYNLIQTL